MRIYTGYGDQGMTRLYGGLRLSKSHLRVEAYGTVDEACSLVGQLLSQMADFPVFLDLIAEVQDIQEQLFDCGSDLATSPGARPYKQHQEQIQWLEGRIDAHKDVPKQVESFILPGGHSLASQTHVIRTVIRRLERRMVALQEEEDINPFGLIYVNRLSDYFFVLARIMNHRLKVEERLYRKSGKIFSTKGKES